MKVLVVQAKGSGGFQEPQTAAYLSSSQPSAAPDNGWVRNLIEQDKVELLADLGDKSDWETFIAEVNRTPNLLWPTALENYRASLGKEATKTEAKKSEKLVDAEKPADSTKAPAEEKK